jgi:pilus assembly protein FimV
LATAAGNAEPVDQAAQQSTSGKVGAPVQDKAAPAAGQPQEVLKLSKNEPATGAADAKAGARVHALEEEVVARDKAVKEANDRVAKLQKQVTDLQALLEMKNKGMADLQKPAATPAAPKAPVPPPSTPPTAATPATPTPEMKPTTPPPATPAPVAPKSDAAPPPTPPAPTAPKPTPVKQPPPMPAPEPSLMDQVLDQPVYLGAALGVLLIIVILGVRAVKRRRESHSDSEDAGPARAFANTGDATVTPLAAVSGAPGAEGGSDQVDPVAEAEIFLAYGRDAQAEELLKDALQTSPQRHDVPLKLLQIYANRKDAKSFEKVARDLQQATGGTGPVWDQAVALGYQVDPGNSRYAAGRTAGAAVLAAASTAAAENVDFNIGGGSDDSTATTTDIDLGDSGSAFERTQIIDPAAEPAHDSTVSIETSSLPSAMDFDVGHAVADTAQAPTEEGGKGLDFDIDLNSLSTGPAPDETVVEPAGGLDFDMGNLTLDTPPEQETQGTASVPELDLSGISLDLGTQTSPTASPTGKDDRWYDVQTKFDLAKAYQEMGDKDGAREILKEVLAEGDTEQKAAAESVLARLDS